MPVAGSANNLVTTILPFLFRIVYNGKRIWFYHVISYCDCMVFHPSILFRTQLRTLRSNFQIESWILVIHFKTYDHLVCRVTCNWIALPQFSHSLTSNALLQITDSTNHLDRHFFSCWKNEKKKKNKLRVEITYSCSLFMA